MIEPYLPSAIMQTTGALLGIYAVVYVLTVQTKIKKGSDLKYSLTGMHVTFMIVTVFALITIFLNFLWLHHLILGTVSEWHRNVATGSFLGTLMLFGFLTFEMLFYHFE